jgi:hypothetical protein
MPGSPPKLLPHLDTWGMGAAEAWLSGWAMAAGKAGPFLSKLQQSLGGFLEDIHAGKDISPDSISATFGNHAGLMKNYLGAYRNVATATSDVAKAREALAEAEESGDQEAIDAAKEKLSLAEDEEKGARRAMRVQEQALAKRIQQEQKVSEAIIQRAEVETKAARDSEALAEEARQRAIAQAYLQYRLAVAGTAAGQIPIWEEELAKAEHGSAEFWQIQTRLVELRRSAEKAAEKVGTGVAGGLAGGLQDGLEKELKDDKLYNDSGAHIEKGMGKIDWAGIGKAIATSLLNALVEKLKEAPALMLEWANDLEAYVDSTEFAEHVEKIGSTIGRFIGAGIRDFLGLDETAEEIGSSMLGMIVKAVMKAASSVRKAAMMLGAEIGFGIVEGLTGTPVPEEQKTSTRNILQDALRAINLIRGLKINMIPDFAGGTSHAPGGLALVGERGPELVHLPRGSQVHTATETRGMLGGGARNVTVNIYNPRDAREAEIGVLRGLRAAGVAA